MTKLLYLGFHCRHCSDYYQQKICAGNLSSRDVAVGISYSGYSQDTVETIREAKKSGATTIVLTNFRDSSHQQICGSADLYQPGSVILRRCHFFTDDAADDCRYDLYGNHRVGLRLLCKTAEPERQSDPGQGLSGGEVIPPEGFYRWPSELNIMKWGK